MSQLNVRITKEEKNLVEKVSQARGEYISIFVRRAVRRELATLGFYTVDERRALGLDPATVEGTGDDVLRVLGHPREPLNGVDT